MMRQTILDLVALGPLPSEEDAEQEQLDRYEALLHAIERSVTDEEARALVELFGPDSCYGLAWNIVTSVETAPGWPLEDGLTRSDNESVEILKIGAENLAKLNASKRNGRDSRLTRR